MAFVESFSIRRLSRNLSRRLASLLPLLVLIGATVIRVADPPALETLRNYAFDNFQRISPRPWTPDILPVRIVDIDERSLREVGQWPWPRSKLAELVDTLTEAGAAVIAFDVLFAEPDRTSPQQMLASLKSQLDSATFERLQASALDNDQIFAEAIKRSGRVVLGYALDRDGSKTPPRQLHSVAYVGDDGSGFLKRGDEGAIRNLEVLENAAAGMGSIMTEIGDVIRYVPLLSMVPGSQTPYPSLAIDSLRVLLQTRTYLVKSSNASDTRAFGVKSGIVSIFLRPNTDAQLPSNNPMIIPTKGDGSIQLYDSGPQPQRFVSAYDVLAHKVDREKLEGQIVLIGSSAAGLKDLRNTPIASAVPGVEVHAQIIEQILLGWLGELYSKVEGAPPILQEMVKRPFLDRPDYALGVEVIYLVVIGLAILLLLPRLRARSMALVGVVGTAAGFIVPWLLFRYQGLLFDPIYPSATVAFMYILGSAFSFIQTELDRAQIRNAFGMYLAPALVERLARNPDQLRLGGETRDLTIMFTDVRGFTTISEQFDAQGLTRFMNRMLTPMTDIILAHLGTIDKYMGDAIMAFWNAPMDEPQHARRACDAALMMQSRLKALNAEWRTEAEQEGRRHIEVRIGVGLNTGPASVGNFGSTQRFTYSALGDPVNLASRLEGQCKTYVTPVIIGEKTREAAADVAALELDLIMVKGKTTPERMFALIGMPELAVTDAFKALEAIHLRFLEAYRAGRFAEAIDIAIEAEDASDKAGWTQGYYGMMRHRCQELIEEPPEDWNGVYVAKEK